MKVPLAGWAIPCPKPFTNVVNIVTIQIKPGLYMKESLFGFSLERVGKISERINGIESRQE
jgi:hypothetical protein